MGHRKRASTSSRPPEAKGFTTVKMLKKALAMFPDDAEIVVFAANGFPGIRASGVLLHPETGHVWIYGETPHWAHVQS